MQQTYQKNSHCSYCGQPFVAEQAWPRRCANCNNVTFVNPLPVAVLLLPVDDGVLVVRRGIQPRLGQLALPGGYIELGEAWQAAAARELYEEAGITVDPQTIHEFRVRSAPDGTVLIFGLAPKRHAADLPPFVPTSEASERVILAEPAELAFSLHTEVVQAFFAQKGTPV
ncbi:MAG: NUDIX domain-containing protein [Chloroflexi bacterium]|nr:NUDIX domain-containing protein [Chloroflexota bacterium]